MAALVDSEMCSRVPVIVILGATGSGKSKLGIEIARKFGGEIISADSMQAYKGLDIITNKVTAEERLQARHHLLDMVTPPRPFSVVEFRDAALPIIDRLLQQKQLPVVVGGTNYYIESLLWKVLVSPGTDLFPSAAASSQPTSEDEGAASQDETTDPVTAAVQSQVGTQTIGQPAQREPSAAAKTDARVATPKDAEPREEDASADNNNESVERKAQIASAVKSGDGGGDRSAVVVEDEEGRSGPHEDPLLPAEPLLKKPRLDPDLMALPSPELHRRLQTVDPDMARRLHPNNRRRIIRSLEVYEQLGRPHSEVLRDQIDGGGGGALGGPLRYPHSAIFWLQCDQATLDARLDARVDDMMERGLVAELLDFHARYNADRIAQNKEADYTKGIFQSIGFKEFHEYLLLPAEERDSEHGQRMFQEAVLALKTVTRRYARKQVRWVVNRFLRQPARQVPPVYAFDTSDPSKWDELVYNPAVDVVECLWNGKTPTKVKPLPLEEPLSNEPTSFHCEVCDRVFIGNIQWNAHITSKKHKKVLRQKKRAQRNQSSSLEKDEDGKDIREGEIISDPKSPETDTKY